MSNIPSPATISAAVGISRSYAWEILNDKRDPSRMLAIRIFRATGWKNKTIATLTDSEIDVFERAENARAAA